MRFPTLLYTDAASENRIPEHVFEDLRLGLLISPDVLRRAGYICCERDIGERQRVFEFLCDESELRRFDELYQLQAELLHMHECLTSASCEQERDAIYPQLLSRYVKFIRMAARADLADDTRELPMLVRRFSDFFASFASDIDCEGLSRELDAIAEASASAFECTFSIGGKKLRFRRGAEPGLEAKLVDCAQKLGVSIESVGGAMSRQLDRSFFESLFRLYPNEFAVLADFYSTRGDVFSEDILRYHAELGFYIEICRLMRRISEHGIPLCYPTVSHDARTDIYDAYDISLLAKQDDIVPNDVHFDPDEHFFFLTGANGGGKTTYLRTVGIAAVLFLMGCPIPAKSAEMRLFDAVLTHFPHDERFSGSGRFVEEDNRVKAILSSVGGDSLVLLNETYSSTDEENALKNTAELASTLDRMSVSGLYVTHQHRLVSDGIPYLNVAVDTSDGNRRTYKIERKREDSSSFACDIIKKYRLTKEALEADFKA